MAEVDVADEMTLRDYASVVWRRKWIVIIPALLTTLVAIALSVAQTPMYRASAEVLVKMPPNAYSLSSTGDVLSPRMVENELQAANGSALKADVREVVGSEPTLSVSVSEGSDVFTFTATSSDPDTAALAANTYAQTYIDQQRQILIDEYATRAEVVQEQLAAIERGESDSTRQTEYEFELEDLAVSTELARTGGSELIDEATAPSQPYEPNTSRTAVLALVVGVLIGLGAAFLIDYLDTSIRDDDDLVRATGLPVLASVPLLPGKQLPDARHLTSRDQPSSPSAEAFRGLHTSLRFMALERPIRTLLVTSARPAEGKTTVATNLAYTAARSGDRVLLIDCDLRKPQAHLFFALPNEIGFTSVLLGEATIRQVAHLVKDADALAVVTAGPQPPNPSELLAGERTQESLERLSESVDLIVLDSPPVLPVSDPVVLAPLVDGVVVVASANSTDRRQLGKSIERLAQVDAPMLGTVLNRYDPLVSGDYSYGYERPTEKDATPDSKRIEPIRPHIPDEDSGPAWLAANAATTSQSGDATSESKATTT